MVGFDAVLAIHGDCTSISPPSGYRKCCVGCPNLSQRTTELLERDIAVCEETGNRKIHVVSTPEYADPCDVLIEAQELGYPYAMGIKP